MEIGSKAKKIIVWSASGLAAAGLLTGTFFTGMAVADNTEPASVTSELDGERPERPKHGDHGDLPQDNDTEGRDSQNKDSGSQDTQDEDIQDEDSQDSGSARPDRPERDGGPDDDGRSGKDGSGKEDAGQGNSKDGHGERGGHGPHHGLPESEGEAPAEDAPARS